MTTDLEKIFELEPTQVKVKEELPRIRKEMKKIEELAESFSKFGQLQPIVINRDLELVAGGRRLAACLLAGRKVKCCYIDTVEPLMMREMELEENLQREDLTPAEEVLAVSEIHELKKKIHGAAVSGKEGSGWRLDDTADLIGKTRGSVIEDLMLANMVKMFPDLNQAKTKSEIKKVAKGLDAVNKRVNAMSAFESILKQTGSRVTIVQADATEHMKTMPDASVDLLLTDPPYGINIDKTMATIGGTTGKTELTTVGSMYSDNTEDSLELYALLAKESIRFTKTTSHAYIFVGPEHFHFVRQIFISAGWIVHVKPIIWIKGVTGQCNVPTHWPASCYEMIMYMRRIDSRLVVEGKPDWVQYQKVVPSERVHQAQKPVDLLKDLIIRTSMPSQTLYDPFCGSGSSVIAALEMKMFPTACDNDVAAYTATMQRIVEWERDQRHA